MSLFRKEALEAQQVSALGRILLFTPRIADALIALVLLFTFLLVLFVIFGSYTRKATVYGELVPVSGAIKVYPPQGGRIEAVEVQSGARARGGTELSRLRREYRAGKDNRGNHGGKMIGCCVFGIAAAIRFADGFSGGLIFLNPIC